MDAVIVARKSDKGKWYVFGACYLNQYPLDDLNDQEDNKCWTGFHCEYKHDDYDLFFEPIDVLFWALMPDPPLDS